jgi:hypothetical protein
VIEARAFNQSKAVWETYKDLASLTYKLSLLLNAKEDEELFYNKEKPQKPRLAEPTYVHGNCRQVLKLIGHATA